MYTISPTDTASKRFKIKPPPSPIMGLKMLQVMILFLLHIHGTLQESSTSYTSSGENNNNKLWLNGNKKQQATLNHQQYLYVLNDTQVTHNYTQSNRPHNNAETTLQPETEEILEASESRLTLSSVASNSTTKTSNKSSKQDKKNTRSTAKPNLNQSNNHPNSKSKNSKFFKNPPKLSISSLLAKSKRQDMLPDTKSRKVRTSRKLPPIRYHQHNNLPAQSRGFHMGQHFVPYPTGSHHVLFGSHLTMPDFYGHFSGHHPGHEMMTGPLAPPPPATATMRHLNAQFQTQQTMPQPFHQSVAPLPDFRTANELTPTIFFPASPPPIPVKNNLSPDTTNSTNNKNSSINPIKQQTNQQQRNKDSTGILGSNNNNNTSHHHLSLPLGAAAAALISERAKNFISHLNRGGLVGGSNSNKKKENAKDTKTATTEQQIKTTTAGITTPANLMKAIPHDNVGLASMMKNAADTWAGASTSSEAAPSILVEHDGPTITTVNFDQHHNLNGPIPHHPRHPYDDDEDDVNTYYESNEEEESEVGGSHDARRVVRYRAMSQHPHPHQQPSHHHNPYLASHPLATLRHLPQQRHVPYPPRYPHSRYPFEQQVQSHTVQTEIPYDQYSSSYINGGSSTLDTDYGDISRKKSFGGGGGGGGDFPQGALQDYLRQQRVIDQPQIYPDSINAIKEQNNGDAAMDKLGDLTSNIGSKLSASNSDQIDLLIKELQELNKIKRNQSMESSSSNTRDSNHRKSKLSLTDADYDDAFGGSGGGGGGNNDEDEEEKLKVLRKKLLNRLRSKARGGRRGNNNGEDSFQGEAIKIPLHTLLLAALDRRMSPSEAHSQSVVSSTGETGGGGGSGGGGEEQRKWPQLDSSPGSGSLVNTLALGRQQDFNEITSGLGSLLTTINDAGGVVDSETGPSSQLMITDRGPPIGHGGSINDNYNKPLSPQVNKSTDHSGEYQSAHPHSPSMFILNNIRLPDQLSIDKGSNESALKSTIETSLELIRKAQNDSEEQLLSTPTTRVPVMRENSGIESTASKKRRQVQQHQNEFDDEKQVEEFTRDVRTDHLGINPEWATRKADKLEPSRKAHQQASSPSSVHFDDEFEESTGRGARNGNGKRRRKMNPSTQRDSLVMDSEDAADFLNKVQMDTDIDGATHIEDPIGLASQEELNNKREEKSVGEELFNDTHNSSPSSSETADESELEMESKGRSADKDEETIWKPQVVDSEMRRLARLARARRKTSRNKINLNDYSGDVDGDDNQVLEDVDVGVDSGKAPLDSADTVMKVTIDSKDGSSARITQHFSASHPHMSNRRSQLLEGKKS